MCRTEGSLVGAVREPPLAQYKIDYATHSLPHVQRREREHPRRKHKAPRGAPLCYDASAYLANQESSGRVVWEFLRGKKTGRQDRASRTPVEIPIHFRKAGDFGWSVGKVRNISRSGVLFRAGTVIPLNTKVEMQFNAPAEIGPVPGELIVARGKVVRTLMPAASDQHPSFAAKFSAYSVVRQSNNW